MTKTPRSDHVLAEEIARSLPSGGTKGAAADAVVLLQRARNAGGGSLRFHFLSRAQRAIAKLDPVRQQGLIQRLQGEILALQGRGGDTKIAHLTPGEVVIPKRLQTPEFMRDVAELARAYGIDPASLVIGDRRNAINPHTGQPEFDDEELQDQAPAQDDGSPASDDTPPPPAAPVMPTNNLRDMADQIADHINSQAASPSSDPNDCQLVPAGGQFKAAPGVTPLFQPHMAEKLTTAIQSLNDQGIVPVMTGGYVSQEAQDKLHTQSANLMAKPAKISAHGIGLGVDFRPNSNSPNVEAIRDAMATAGLQNGANFKNNPDPNHYFSPDAPQKQTPAMVQACADAYAKLILGDQE